MSNRTLAARQFKAPRQSDLGLVKKGDTDGKWDSSLFGFMPRKRFEFER